MALNDERERKRESFQSNWIAKRGDMIAGLEAAGHELSFTTGSSEVGYGGKPVTSVKCARCGRTLVTSEEFRRNPRRLRRRPCRGVEATAMGGLRGRYHQRKKRVADRAAAKENEARIAAEQRWISRLPDGLIDALERGGHQLQISTSHVYAGPQSGTSWKTTMECQRCGWGFWGRRANSMGIGLTTKRQCAGSLARLEHYRKLPKTAVSYIAVVFVGGLGFTGVFQHLDSSDRFPTWVSDLLSLVWAIPVFALFRTGRRRWAWIIAVAIWIVFISLLVAT